METVSKEKNSKLFPMLENLFNNSCDTVIIWHPIFSAWNILIISLVLAHKTLALGFDFEIKLVLSSLV